MAQGGVGRRTFIRHAAAATAGLGLSASAGCERSAEPVSATPLFELSLAEWSLHRTLFGAWFNQAPSGEFARRLHTDPRSVLQGSLDHLDFARTARQDFGIGAIEYVNTFFFDRAADGGYLSDMKSRADGEGVRSLLIMCDSEGRLGDPDATARATTIENHRKWIEAAAFLGCHAIRVNAASDGTRDEQARLAADGLAHLAEVGDAAGLDVIVENHGGVSSDGRWLAEVLALADHPRLGTLPDFGNFDLGNGERYDQYQGVAELMPFARAVSAKSYDFTSGGDETTIDFERMMRIVLGAGYRGHVGIEYEGARLGEADGIRATKRLLERVRDAVANDFR